MTRMFFRCFDNDEHAMSVFKDHENNILPKRTHDCYSVISSAYIDKNIPLYFGFYADKRIRELSEHINSRFNNIKVVILGIEEFGWAREQCYYHRIGKDMYQRFTVGGRSFVEKHDWALFRFEFNEDYTNESVFVLTTAMAQFLRIMCPEYAHYSWMDETIPLTIEGVCTAFNKAAQQEQWYGTWATRYNSNPETVLKFDDIELINTVTKGIDTDDMPYVSQLLKSIDRDVTMVKTTGECPW